MPMIINGIKYSPAFTVYKGGGEDSGGEYLIKVIDYDGTVLKQDHLDTGATFELPEPPTNHERLLFQTWSSPLQITNNTITVGKSDVTIGAIYTTKSGLNEYVVEITPITGLTVTLSPSISGAIVDWGDGTTESGVIQGHTYSEYDTYIIKTNDIYAFPKLNGDIFYQDNNTKYAVKEIYCGNVSNAVAGINLNFCPFENISLSNSIFAFGSGFFSGIYTLKTLILPPYIMSYDEEEEGILDISVIQQIQGVRDLVLPYGLHTIKNNNFNLAYELETITFPATVTTIASPFRYLWNCKALNFTEHQEVPVLTVTNNLFQGISPRCYIRVPKALESQWKTATNWSAFADRIVGV